MRSTNTNFDAKHDLAYKTPMYLVHFDGEAIDYCAHKPVSPTNTLKQYLMKISGLGQKVTPEEGRSSIGGISVELLDYNDELTSLWTTDAYFFHRKKTTIKAGYAGMSETDMLSILTGWITGKKLNKDLLAYICTITDPQKWMQRKIFRGSEDSAVILSGNPLTILLACLTSTGNGTNGDYDYLAAADSLGIDLDHIDVSGIETVRDDWFPGDSHRMQFDIRESITAKTFFQNEIFKVLNIYPSIDGQGRFTVKPFKPPLPATQKVQTFDADTIIGLPQWDENLQSLVNELELYYDYDAAAKEFDTRVLYIDSTSVNNRGPGKKTFIIKSKGLHSTPPAGGSIVGRAADILSTRKKRFFGRWATPPVKISFSVFFSRWLSEAGDVAPLTHSLLPDLKLGTRGITSKHMEIINRTINWKEGKVKIDLLDTGFDKGTYNVISPAMTITAVTDRENFTVSVADAAKYAYMTNPEIQICDSKMRQKVMISDNLVGYWPLDETSGSIAPDRSGNGNNGTLINMENADWVDGVVGKCLSFDGVDEDVSIPSSPSLEITDVLSVSMWVYYISGNGRIFQKDGAGYTRCWETGVHTGLFRMEMWHSDGATTVQSANALTVNGWMHLVMTFDGTDIKMYQDAILTKTFNFPGNIHSDSGTPLFIGGRYNTEYFNGLIDEVRIYNTVLTASKIKALYLSPGPGSVTILSVNTTTGAIIIDNPGVDLSVGDIISFANYNECTAEQKNWGFIADSSNHLGTSNDDAHLIAP